MDRYDMNFVSNEEYHELLPEKSKDGDWVKFEDAIEEKTKAFSKSIQQGIILTFMEVIRLLRKENLIQTEVGKIVFNFCENTKEEISNTKLSG